MLAICPLDLQDLAVGQALTDEYVLPGHTRCLDTLSNLFLVVIDRSGINMTIPGLEGNFHCVLDFIWFGLLGILLAFHSSPFPQESRPLKLTQVPSPTAGTVSPLLKVNDSVRGILFQMTGILVSRLPVKSTEQWRWARHFVRLYVQRFPRC